MSRLLLVFVAASFAVGAAVAGGSVRTPSLKILRASPLVVQGTGFHARELVTVTASGGRVRVRATVVGGFVASLKAGDRCSAGRIVATGSAGDQVVLRLPPAMCAPASPG